MTNDKRIAIDRMLDCMKAMKYAENIDYLSYEYIRLTTYYEAYLICGWMADKQKFRATIVANSIYKRRYSQLKELEVLRR